MLHIPYCSFTLQQPSVKQHTSVKPLSDRVLAKISHAKEKTKGGILLPATTQSKP